MRLRFVVMPTQYDVWLCNIYEPVCSVNFERSVTSVCGQQEGEQHVNWLNSVTVNAWPCSNPSPPTPPPQRILSPVFSEIRGSSFVFCSFFLIFRKLYSNAMNKKPLPVYCTGLCICDFASGLCTKLYFTQTKEDQTKSFKIGKGFLINLNGTEFYTIL